MTAKSTAASCEMSDSSDTTMNSGQPPGDVRQIVQPYSERLQGDDAVTAGLFKAIELQLRQTHELSTRNHQLAVELQASNREKDQINNDLRERLAGKEVALSVLSEQAAAVGLSVEDLPGEAAEASRLREAVARMEVQRDEARRYLSESRDKLDAIIARYNTLANKAAVVKKQRDQALQSATSAQSALKKARGDVRQMRRECRTLEERHSQMELQLRGAQRDAGSIRLRGNRNTTLCLGALVAIAAAIVAIPPLLSAV